MKESWANGASTRSRWKREATLPRRVSLSAAFLVLALGVGHGIAKARGQASLPAAGNSGAPSPRYLDPSALQLSPNGRWLYVVCQNADTLLVVDTRTQQVVERVPVGRRPEGIALSPRGKTLYVSNEWSDTVSEIDTATLRTVRTLRVGSGPVGLTTDRAGKFLYAANTLGDDVSIIDLSSGKEVKRLSAGHFPEYVALSQDGKRVYVSNLLAQLAPPDDPPTSEVTVIDTAKQEVVDRVMVPGTIELRRIAQVPPAEGGYFLIPFLQPHNLIPLIQIRQDWYVSHGMAVVQPAKRAGGKARVVEILLDDVDRDYADNFGAVVTPDGREALVTASGANLVSVIDVAKLNRLLSRVPANDPGVLADRLDSARKFVVRRIPTGREPVAVVVSPDGRTAYIANRTDDSVTVIDLRTLQATSTIDLAGRETITARRRGQQLFFNARFSNQGQLACATCHPHQGFENGLAWSLETPELGRDVVENKTLLAIKDISPYKWNGANPNLATQDGPRTAMYIFRSQGFGATEVRDLVSFVQSLRLPPNPHVGPGGNLNERQELGRKIFFRDKTNDGRTIPLNERCYFCHPPQTHYTLRVVVNVGTSTSLDTNQGFKIPQLDSIYMRPPYLHNGEALTLEEIWTKYNPDDKHGVTSDMNKVQLNDLIEFLKTM